jgi:hypothetical protein
MIDKEKGLVFAESPSRRASSEWARWLWQRRHLRKTLPSEEFTDVSLKQWLRRAPSEMLKAYLNIDKEMAMKIPAEKLVVI